MGTREFFGYQGFNNWLSDLSGYFRPGLLEGRILENLKIHKPENLTVQINLKKLEPSNVKGNSIISKKS